MCNSNICSITISNICSVFSLSFCRTYVPNIEHMFYVTLEQLFICIYIVAAERMFCILSNICSLYKINKLLVKFSLHLYRTYVLYIFNKNIVKFSLHLYKFVFFRTNVRAALHYKPAAIKAAANLHS